MNHAKFKFNGVKFIVLLVVIVFSMCGTVFAAQDATQDIVTIGCVSFHPVWGDKTNNLKRMETYIDSAAQQGVNIVVFPEMCLTGYDVDDKENMQKENAETIPGPATNEISKLAAKYGMYVVLGMPESDPDNSNIIYNSAAVIGPQGVIGSYRKIHLANPEPKWATKGSDPFLFDSPWGPIGVGICFDTYTFPELVRYNAAMGARLYINITATGGWYRSVGRDAWEKYYSTRLEARAGENGIFIASADLVGKDKTSDFPGGSVIIGPGPKPPRIAYYGGSLSQNKAEIVIAKIDLSKAKRDVFQKNPITGTTDWRLDIDEKLLKNVQDKTGDKYLSK